MTVPIDLDEALGALVSDAEYSWDERDVLLYHLAVGAGCRPDASTDLTTLGWLLEDERLQVLPSFALVVPTLSDPLTGTADLPGCELDVSRVLQGAQAVWMAGPIPTRGTARIRTTITDVWDKGSAAVIWQEAVATDPSGGALWRARSSLFVRGEGGWGGPRGDGGTPLWPPDREPDAETTFSVPSHQALLYRLMGDRNLVHADPEFARVAGFPAPILHGLCTYGIVLRELIEALLGADPATVGQFTARFAGVVFPGETLRVRAWQVGDALVASVTVADAGPRQGATVLDQVELVAPAAGGA